MASWLDRIQSRRPRHKIQPEELSIIADFITIFKVVEQRDPTRAELIQFWRDMGGDINAS